MDFDSLSCMEETINVNVIQYIYNIHSLGNIMS
jgi:hypothetical protein